MSLSPIDRGWSFLGKRPAIVMVRKNKDEPIDYSLVIHGRRYIATESIRLIYKSGDNRFDVNNLSWGEYWKIQVYDTSQDDLPRKEYDLLKAISDYDASYFPVSSAYTHFYDYHDQEYRTVVLQKTGATTVRKFF